MLRGIRVIRSLPPKRKSTVTHRAHASIHLVGRCSGPARLLRGALAGRFSGPARPLRGTRRLGSLLISANSVEQKANKVCE